MSRRIGCLAVHYGKEYLAWAVKSLAAAVDEVHVFYTPTPSFGHVGNIPNPDSEEQLVAEANRFAQVTWHRVTAFCENGHRDQMLEEAQRRGARLVAIADADEIWDPQTLKESLDGVERTNLAGRWLANFHNFWRSWRYTVWDHFHPIRIVDLAHPLDKDAYLADRQRHPIYHFGYAQTIETMRYKLSCHGHKNEFKPGWFEQKFLAWDYYLNNTDLHPCINNFWTSELTSLDVMGKLNELMPGHPHQNLTLIV